MAKKTKSKMNSMLILGIIAVVAIIGLVLMFTQTGSPSGRLINPDPYTTAGGKSGYDPGAWESGPVHTSWTKEGAYTKYAWSGGGSYIGEAVPAAPYEVEYPYKYRQPGYPEKQARGYDRSDLTYPYS